MSLPRQEKNTPRFQLCHFVVTPTESAFHLTAHTTLRTNGEDRTANFPFQGPPKNNVDFDHDYQRLVNIATRILLDEVTGAICDMGQFQFVRAAPPVECEWYTIQSMKVQEKMVTVVFDLATGEVGSPYEWPIEVTEEAARDAIKSAYLVEVDSGPVSAFYTSCCSLFQQQLSAVRKYIQQPEHEAVGSR